MTTQEIVELLEDFGIPRNDMNLTAEWVRSPCPMAPWTHEKGTDSSPSFGIKINEGGASGFHCFSEGCGGALPVLVWRMSIFSQEIYPVATSLCHTELARLVEDEVPIDERFLDKVEIENRFAKVVMTPIRQYTTIPQEVEGMFPLLMDRKDDGFSGTEVYNWLKDARHISDEAIDHFKIRVRGGKNPGVVFPIYTNEGELADLWIRHIGEKKFYRLSHEVTETTVDYSASELWFGGNLMQLDRPVMPVEGALDALRVFTLGFRNVIASMGLPSHGQIATLWHKDILDGLDRDKAGMQASKRAKKVWGASQRYRMMWDMVQRHDGKPCKDGGDVLNATDFKKVLLGKRKFS